ncbi:hypothetical protein [Cyanobacterium sp. uoEpiScrs1]|nr:hypothetical protein [Cyanobacterium sp. uoEpiScrs1]
MNKEGEAMNSRLGYRNDNKPLVAIINQVLNNSNICLQASQSTPIAGNP